MYVSKETSEMNRESLLRAASHLFRARGIDGVGVAEIAKEAGLTHGALYKQFGSKEELAAEAFYHPIAVKKAEVEASKQEPKQSLDGRLDAMFSLEHRDNLADGCPMTASASEIARHGTPVTASFTRAFKESVASLEALMQGSIPVSKRRQLAVSALAAQIGAMAVARAVAQIDPSLSTEVLRSVRETLKPIGAPSRRASAKTTSRRTGAKLLKRRKSA